MRDQLQALDRRHDRDRRRDDRVAGEQRRAGDAEQEIPASNAPPRADCASAIKRQRAALAAIVGSHQEDDIFDRDGEDQRQDQQRDRADDRFLGEDVGLHAMRERLAQRVERARADVAVNDADGADDEPGEAALGVFMPLAGRRERMRRRPLAASGGARVRSLRHGAFLLGRAQATFGGACCGRGASMTSIGPTKGYPSRRRAPLSGAAIYALLALKRRPLLRRNMGRFRPITDRGEERGETSRRGGA